LKTDLRLSLENLDLITNKLQKEFDTERTYINNVINLHLQGATVQFIARFRKELTDKMSEEFIHKILTRFDSMVTLEEQKESVIESIKNLNKITPSILKEIKYSNQKYELDDILFSFKSKTTKESISAKEKGLESLAIQIYLQKSINYKLKDLATKYVNPDKGINSPEDALDGASHVIIEWITEDTECRKKVRELLLKSCTLTSFLKEDADKSNTQYKDYFKFSKSIKSVSFTEIYDILRGLSEAVLNCSIAYDKNVIYKFISERFIRTREKDYYEFLYRCVKKAFEYSILPGLAEEIKENLKKSADENAVEFLGKQIRTLILSQPSEKNPVMGISNEANSVFKTVAINSNGSLLEQIELSPLLSEDEVQVVIKTIKGLMKKHEIKTIILGNGEDSTKLVNYLKDSISKDEKINIKLIDETLARIYADSEVSSEEFNDLERGYKIAIFLSRYHQDPMLEIVKIDPFLLCGNNYVKDIDKSLLIETLDWHIRSCVNFVGIDLNRASISLLKYVSGLNENLARNIISYRKNSDEGYFVSRKELLKVEGVNSKIYEQCAGFLRIINGIHPLDATFIHPENYHIVSRIANKYKCRIQDLIENPKILSKINYNQFMTKSVGLPTIRDIIYELGNPYRDPRKELKNVPVQKSTNNSFTDLTINSVLLGKVIKTTNFGVFMNIGVDIDGFVHISEISDKFIKDPSSVLSVGETIKVKIISIDPVKRRISLSIKQAQESSK
jgi:protein Tex